MDKILTGTYGVNPKERSYNQSFFRVMSRMAIAEDQSLVRVSPCSGANIMKNNPHRDPQVYLADLSCISVQGGEMQFSVDRLYSLEYGVGDHVYLNGVMLPATVVGNIVRVDDAMVAPSVNVGMKASLLSGVSIDFQLDWQEHINSEVVSAMSDEFIDVPIRVESGVSRDSYSQWREIMPNMATVRYTGDGSSVMLDIDIGIICASLRSGYAPREIEFTMRSDVGSNYSVHLYLNIDDIPSSILPWYPMHPGQFLHNVQFEYQQEGIAIAESNDNMIIMPETVVGVSGGDIIEVTQSGGTREYEVASVDNNVIILVGEDRAMAGDVYVRKVEYDYTDGVLFDLSSPESFRTPQRAYMFILRATLELMAQPHLIKEKTDLSISGIVYHFHVAGDNLFPSYAVCHYDSEYIDGKYRESCDISNDTIESMRYIGHYGRNPVYGSNEVPLGYFDVNMHVAPYILKSKDIISDMSVLSVGKSSIDILLSDIVQSTDAKEEVVVNGFYKTVVNPLPARIASSVLVSKLYLLDPMVTDDEIYAELGSKGYTLTKKNDGVIDDDFDNFYIGRISDEVSLDRILFDSIPGLPIPTDGYIMVGREIIKYTDGKDSGAVMSQRACFGSNEHDIDIGDDVHYVSYITYNDIHPNAIDVCSYTGPYKPKITLPISNHNDPQLFGATPVYLVEVQYEKNVKIKA